MVLVFLRSEQGDAVSAISEQEIVLAF